MKIVNDHLSRWAVVIGNFALWSTLATSGEEALKIYAKDVRRLLEDCQKDIHKEKLENNTSFRVVEVGLKVISES